MNLMEFMQLPVVLIIAIFFSFAIASLSGLVWKCTTLSMIHSLFNLEELMDLFLGYQPLLLLFSSTKH